MSWCAALARTTTASCTQAARCQGLLHTIFCQGVLHIIRVDSGCTTTCTEHNSESTTYPRHAHKLPLFSKTRSHHWQHLAQARC
jgi:hypothetical protein